MKIKSLLIGSAAALSSATVVSAADAIVAAEPEAVEYVRVCDAFGTGYFYIPGTETCLRISGYARFEVGFSRNRSGRSDWDATSRGQLRFDARSETELGVLRSYIDLRAQGDNDSESTTTLTQAFIEVGGLRVGKFDTWWDNDLSGETDNLGNLTNNNSIRYTFGNDGYGFGIAVDELEGSGATFADQGVVVVGTTSTYSLLHGPKPDNNIGIAAQFSAKFGGVDFALLGGYDTDRSDGAIRAILSADLGPGALGFAALWSSAPNAYYAASEWALAAEYAIQATDRLKITPSAQWHGNLQQKIITGGVFNSATNTWTTAETRSATLVSDDWSNHDAWRAGVTVDYAITTGLSTKITANYYDADHEKGAWTGFVRLDRSF